MLSRKLIAASVLFGTMTLGLAAQEARLSHHLPSTHFIHEAAEAMASNVREKTGGAVEIGIYPSAQLYDADNAIQALIQGNLDLAMVSVRAFAHFAPAVDVVSLPYLFKSDQQARRAMNGKLGDQIAAIVEKQLPVKILGYMEFGPGNLWVFSSGKAVKTPKDWAGLKIRAPMEGVEEWIRSAGGQPVNIPSGDVYTALDRGMIDGTITNTQGALDRRWNEVATNFTETPSPAIWIVLVLAASAEWWDGLTPEQQKIVEQAANDAQKLTEQAVQTQLDGAREKIKGLGGDYYIVEPALFEQWISQAEPVWQHFRENFGEEGAALVDLARD